MLTAVDKVKKGKGRTASTRFAMLCAHCLYDTDLCNVASDWEKGVVEKNVQDSRRRIWIDAGKQRFGSFVKLNAWLDNRCRALWEEVRHSEHDRFSVAERPEHERPHGMPMPAPFHCYVEKPARVSSTCLVSVTRKRYSVLCELAGQMISTRLYPGSVVAVAGDAVVARHERRTDRGQTCYDGQHYLLLLQRKPGARARIGHLVAQATAYRLPTCPSRCSSCVGRCCAIQAATGGWRRCCAKAPSTGLDAVLVAVELALEAGPPGRVSVAHVINVLGRLNAAPVPLSAATTLQVAVPPVAYTARYDSLRSKSSADDIDGHSGITSAGTDRAVRSVRHQMHAAKFQAHRDLVGFDFALSSVGRKRVNLLSDTGFTEDAHNAVLVSEPGTGKTHLATAIGVAGITRHGKRVRFYSTVDLVNSLEQEKAQGKAGRVATSLLRRGLIMLDELG